MLGKSTVRKFKVPAADFVNWDDVNDFILESAAGRKLASRGFYLDVSALVGVSGAPGKFKLEVEATFDRPEDESSGFDDDNGN